MDTKIAFAIAAAVFLYSVSSIWRKLAIHQKLSAIPTVGPSGILTSYIGAVRFHKHAQKVTQGGYDKYRGSIFKIPMFTQWMVVVTGPQSIEDMRLAADDQLSSKGAATETLHTDIIFGPAKIHDDNFHAEIIKSQLTRNLAVRFSDIRDEIAAAFADAMPAKGNEWTTVMARRAVLSVVSRTINRFLVGLPLCRDPDYMSFNEQLNFDVIMARSFLSLFPLSLRHFVARFLRKVPEGIKCGMKHLEPLIKERIEQERQYGDDWKDKPNDAITWLLEVAKEPHRRISKHLTTRILHMNFAIIHVTTVAFLNALFYLAAHPEYVQPMREEVEAAIGDEGWTKSAMGKLRKMDSFLRESMRLTGDGAFNVRRKVLKDFTFSNGTTVPAGCMLGIPHRSVHCDPDNYSDPEIFDGFRYAKMRENEGEGIKHGMATLTPDYLAFGQGRHACPGRFFAAINAKAMLAHVLLNYDIKMPNEGGRPSELWLGLSSIPDPTAQLMFRKRA